MAPHKRAASLLQISSALISQQLLLLLIGKREIAEDEEESEENVMRPIDRGEENTRNCDSERKDQSDLGNQSELGNSDLVEILASLGLLTGMMDTILESLNAKIGTNRK